MRQPARGVRGSIEGLRERGLRIPEDVSVIGVDDSLPGRLTRP
ncbi:substrate-binding domain-containing protein, partial [Nonomuraea africana]